MAEALGGTASLAAALDGNAKVNGASMSHASIWLGNDNLIELSGLTVAATSQASPGATVTAVVKNGASVVSGASNITLSATSAGSNDYRGVLGSTVSLPAGARLRVDITATSSSGAKGIWRVDAKARRRGI